MGFINYFLIGFKFHSPQWTIYLVCLQSQELIARQVVGPRGEPSTVIMLNVWTINLMTYHYTRRSIHAHTLVWEDSVCSHRSPQLIKVLRITDCRMSSHKWMSFHITHPSQVQRSLMKRRWKHVRDRRSWWIQWNCVLCCTYELTLISKAFAMLQDRANLSMKMGLGCKVSPLAVELEAPASCEGKERTFSPRVDPTWVRNHTSKNIGQQKLALVFLFVLFSVCGFLLFCFV